MHVWNVCVVSSVTSIRCNVVGRAAMSLQIEPASDGDRAKVWHCQPLHKLHAPTNLLLSKDPKGPFCLLLNIFVVLENCLVVIS